VGGHLGVDDLADALRVEVAKLATGATLNIIEFGSEGIVAWEIRRDRNGIPRARYWPQGPASPSFIDDYGYDVKLRELLDAEGRLLCVITSMDEISHAMFEEFKANRPDMSIFYGSFAVAALLRRAIVASPLTHRYELVVLRPGQRGQLLFDLHELFAASTPGPKRTNFRIRCEPADEGGTVFAVVATEGARDFQLVSVQAADIGPGVYDMTAELVRPGLVMFGGLPVPLRSEHRSWPDLVAEVPVKVAEAKPAHLICAIEVSGSTEQLLRRVDRARQLLRQAHDSTMKLRISLITYGAHSFDRKVPDEPATVLRWGISHGAALSALAELENRHPPTDDYPRAAQIECVLALLIERLGAEKVGPGPDRPVLVTIGARPPFPPRVDPRTSILPCPRRNDWYRDRRLLTRAYTDIAFGAIYDGAGYARGTEGAVWRDLGATAFASGEYVDPRRLAVDLKLRMSAEGLPFPLAETGGS
jgi:hypothetical protein